MATVAKMIDSEDSWEMLQDELQSASSNSAPGSFDDAVAANLAEDATQETCPGVTEDEDWMPEAILKRRRHKGSAYYLVKWRGHDEPTWETEEDLEEEGHVGMLSEFKMHAKKNTAVSCKLGKTRQLGSPQIDIDYGLLSFWPDFERRIQKSLELAGAKALEIYNVMSESAVESFKQECSGVPTMLYVETTADEVIGIVTRGFKLRRFDRHGVTLMLVGATTYPWCPSLGRSFEYLFVCAGALKGDGLSNDNGSRLFFKSSQVLPCYLVKYVPYGIPAPEGPCVYKGRLDVDELGNRITRGVSLHQPLLNGPVRQLVLDRREVHHRRCDAASRTSLDPTSLRSGSDRPGARYDSSHTTLTKRQLRAMPRSAKEAYKNGLLKQKKN